MKRFDAATLKNKAWRVARQLVDHLPGFGPPENAWPPVFIAGCQRSGTTMLLDVLRGLDGLRVFPEGDREAFGREMRILPHDMLRDLIYRNRGMRVVLKPLNDIQHLDSLLAIHPEAKAVWIYRDYRDVASSLVEKWGDAQQAHLRELATGHFSGPGSAALGEKLNAYNTKLVKSLADTHVSAHEAAALIWAFRNALYFDLALDERPDVLLVRYEDLCTQPSRFFPPLFEFLGCGHQRNSWRDVHADSVSRHVLPKIGKQTKHLCDDLLLRLDVSSGRVLAASPANDDDHGDSRSAHATDRHVTSARRATSDTDLTESKRQVS